MLHTIGDSHSYSGFRGMKNFVNHHLGPVTAHSVGRDGLAKCNIKPLSLQIGDSVMFSFGEIDCRCHIKVQADKLPDYPDFYLKVIVDVVKRYMETIKLNMEDLVGVRAFVYNVVPPRRRGSFKENPLYPLVGSDEERLSYVTHFNKLLRLYSAMNGYVYFDIYRHFADEDGFMIPELSDGDVHIDRTEPLREFLALHGVEV